MKSLVCSILIALGLLHLSLPAAAEEATSRVWTDVKGRQVKAMLVGLDGEQVSIQTDAGQIFTFPLSNLSPDDQAYAKSAKVGVAYITADVTVAKAARKIDELVAKGLTVAAQKIGYNNEHVAKPSERRVVPKANPLMTDEQFVRRVHLDIAGRIPTWAEAREFLASTSKTKRADLIAQLLNSPGYVSHTFNYFAEMLRVVDDLEGAPGLRGAPFVAWLKREIEANTPWDKMVAAMLTADGKAWDSGGATGYLLRDIGMPLDNMANTLAVFLGTDVSCAQCHDHPFADWTQHQFYQMAAFFGATTTDIRTSQRRARSKKAGGEMMMEINTDDIANKVLALIEKGGGKPDEERGGLNQLFAPNRFVVSDTNENVLRLPGDYKYKDARPGDLVMPKLMMWDPKADASNAAYKENKLGKKAKMDRMRDTFAAWLTHKDNPRFAMAIANRLWKRAFGVAVNEPVTNIDDPSKCSNPELLLHLTAEMKRLKFDMKAFMEIIYNTETYQREATTEAVPMGEPYYFQGPLVRRMTAEQAWDSYMTLMLGSEIDKRRKPLNDLYEKSISIDLANPKLDPKVVLQKYAAFKTMNEKTQAAERSMMEALKSGGSEQAEARIGDMLLMRASELNQPMMAGHFLSEFGQSQRRSPDAGIKGGSVPQVLMMMNGDTQAMLTNPSASLVFKNMATLTAPQHKIECVFLSVLSRKPTATELERAMSEVSASGDAGYSDLTWALLNTMEFIFVQ